MYEEALEGWRCGLCFGGHGWTIEGEPCPSCNPLGEPSDCDECYGAMYDSCGNPCPSCNPGGEPPIPITPVVPSDDGGEEIIWNCGVCYLLIVGNLHCNKCGSCCPWGCGFDHEDESDEPTDDCDLAEEFGGLNFGGSDG
jgi:hypothetical protein